MSANEGDLGNVVVINSSGVAEVDVLDSLRRSDDTWAKPMVAALTRWTRDVQGQGPSRRRLGNYFERDRFLSPEGTFAQIEMARRALGDDVVGGAADGTEALIFKEMSLFCSDEDQEDAWNQWQENTIRLPRRFAEMWRQLFTDSHVVVGVLWGRRRYTVRGETEAGLPRRKTFDVTVPTAISVLDTLKVTPVGTMLFGRERLAYIANSFEADAFDRILGARPVAGPGRRGALRLADAPITTMDADDIVESLIERRYEPDEEEAAKLAADGVPTEDLFLLRSEAAFRHTLTKPGYRRFADVRMEGVFPLLDLKHQLRSMDRTFLIGGINFLLVITQGTDDHPAQQEEIDFLRGNVSVIARVPVIVADHRLSVEIVTPKVDLVLDPEKHDTIDERIKDRLYQQFGKSDDAVELGKVVGEGLERRRGELAETIRQELLALIVDRNEEFTEVPDIEFRPDQISLAFDANWATFLLDLRAANEISRDTIHGQFGFNQRREFIRRQREAEHYDETFATINPFGSNPPQTGDPAASPSPGAKRSAGRRGGGTRNGGGASPGSGQGKPPRNPRRTSD